MKYALLIVMMARVAAAQDVPPLVEPPASASPPLDAPYVMPEPPPAQPKIFAPIFDPNTTPPQPVSPIVSPIPPTLSDAQVAYLRKRAQRSLRFRKASHALFMTGFGLTLVGLATSITALAHHYGDTWHDPFIITSAAIGGALSVTESIAEPLRAVANDDARAVARAGIMTLQF